MRDPGPSDTRRGAELVQGASVFVMIVTTICIDAHGAAQRSAANTFDWCNRLDQGKN